MVRWWTLAVAGLVAAAAGVSACNRGRGVLDPGAPGSLPGAGGGAGGGDGGAAAVVDGGAGMSTDGRIVTSDAGATMSAAGITTAPPTSACAMSAGRPPPVFGSPNIGGCGGWLDTTASLVKPAAAVGQAYQRCGTLGPEAGWRVTLSPNASHLAARTGAGTVRLFETDGWREIAQLASPVGRLDAVAFSPDGRRLAAVSAELGQVTLWNVADGSLAAAFDGPPVSTLGPPSSALAFSSDGRRLATSLGTVIDLQTGAMTSFGGQPVGPYTAQVNPAGRNNGGGSTQSLRFVGCDQRLLVHSATGSGMLGWIEQVSFVDPVSGQSTIVAGGRFAGVDDLVTSPDGRWVAFVRRGPEMKGLVLYDAASATLVAFDPNPPGAIAGFSRAGNRLFVVTGGAFEVRQVPTLAPVRRGRLPPDLSDGVTEAAVSPRDEVIVSLGNTSAWLDAATGVINRREPFAIGRPEFSADGRYGATDDGTGVTLFHLWREGDASHLCAPAAAPPGTAIGGMALSQDGKTLALVNLAGIVQLHDVTDSGEVGPARATVVTAVEADASDSAVAVANGGTRVAVRGHPSSTTGMPDLGVVSRVVVADSAGRLLFARHVGRSVGRLALSPDGTSVAFPDANAADSHQIAVAVDTGATLLSFPVAKGYQIDSFSPDSKRLAVASGDGISVWDLASGAYAGTYARTGSSLHFPGLSPDWSMMASVVVTPPGAWDKPPPMLVWHSEDGSVVREIGGSVSSLEAPPLLDLSNAVVATFQFVTHTLGGNWYAWHVWSVADGAELRAFSITSDWREPLLALPGGRQLLRREGPVASLWCR
jgi:WD40 repeat protein